jgi:hypothetical protein
MPNRRLACLLLLLTTTLPFAASAQRQPLTPAQIKLEALAQDTQRMSSEDDGLELVWWLPSVYWDAAANSSGLPASSKAEFLKAFDGYVMVAVVQGKMGLVGVDRFLDAEEALAGLQLVDTSGKAHKALRDEQIPAQLRTMLAVMKPILANMIGPMGTNMHFAVFKDRDAKGKPLFDPLGSGWMKVITNRNTHAFRLPLGSLLAPQQDPANGDVFPGDYLYSPYTGAPLKSAPQP